MPETDAPSKSVEDFLKAVYVLENEQDGGRVSTNTLRDALSITAPSVTDMAQRLVSAGLVDYQKYRGVVLTDAGREIALRVIRRHRLIELYLMRELGYALHEVHDEAERLEHAVSDRFVEAIAHKLDDPLTDPHGDPIPAADGTVVQRELVPLTQLGNHIQATVCRLLTSDGDMLQHILDRGFHIDARIEIVARDPFDGPITALIDGEQRVIGHHVAAHVLVAEEA